MRFRSGGTHDRGRSPRRTIRKSTFGSKYSTVLDRIGTDAQANSSTLVASLNLTSTIRSPSPPSPFTPEQNITALLGFTTKDLGTVTLDILAGRNDRLVRGWPFVVFEVPSE